MGTSENKKEEMSLVAMQIILHAGDAKILIDKALTEMKSFQFEQAKVDLKEADECILQAHNVQTKIIQDEASGSDYPNCLLFNHAQDTLMTCKSHYDIAHSVLEISMALWEKIETCQIK